MSDGLKKAEGTRERKRRETHRKLTETGLTLFAQKGFEGTTLDDIASAAGIARRTFFHYFSSKEEIILAWQNGLPESLYAGIVSRGNSTTPFGVVSEALLAMTISMDPDIAALIARLTQSNEQLRMGNQMKFLRMEEAAYAALCALWPAPQGAPALKMAAMAATGAMRLAVDDWLCEACQKPLGDYLRANILSLQSELFGD